MRTCVYCGRQEKENTGGGLKHFLEEQTLCRTFRWRDAAWRACVAAMKIKDGNGAACRLKPSKIVIPSPKVK